MSVYAAGSPGQSKSSLREGDTPQFRVFAVGVVCLNLALLVMAALQAQSTLPNTVEFLVWVILVAIAGFVH